MIGRGISGGKVDGTRRSLSSTCPNGRWKRCRLSGCERVALDGNVVPGSDVTILRPKKALRSINLCWGWFVKVQLSHLPSAEECCSKKNCELSFFGHGNPAFRFCG